LDGLLVYEENVERCGRLYKHLHSSLHIGEGENHTREDADAFHDTIERIMRDEEAAKVTSDSDFIEVFRRLFEVRVDRIHRQEINRKQSEYFDGGMNPKQKNDYF
jgi:hypothetical protein